MKKKPTAFAQSTDIDYKLFDKILSTNDFTGMDMMEVVKKVYEATCMYYSFMYYQAKSEEEHIYKKILEKNKRIEVLEDELKTLRENLPEETQTTAQ